MDYQQLMITDDGEITAPQKQFRELHKEIVYCGNTATAFVVKMAQKLKEMRDSKLYTAAGFKSFEEYTETALGIKERQAYNYIKIVEELPEGFLHSNAKIGITKLLLLAETTSDIRTEVAEESDAESLSVRELKSKIEELEAEKEKLQLDFDEMLDSQKTFDEDAELKAAKEEAEKAAELGKEKIQKLSDEKAKLEKKVAKAEEEVKKLKDQPKEVQTVSDPETETKLKAAETELKTAKETLSARNDEIQTLNKKLIIAADTVMSKFNIKFEDWQRLSTDVFYLVAQMDAERREKCMSAIKKTMEGWKL